MKKIYLLTFIFILLLSLTVSAKGLELVGGLTYNTLEMDTEWKIDNDYDESPDEINLDIDGNNGAGFYAGVRYWFNDKLAAGLGYDSVKADLSLGGKVKFNSEEFYSLDLEEEIELAGPYGEIVFRVNDYLSFSGSIVKYDLETSGSYSYGEYGYSDSSDITLFEGDGLGYILAVDLKYPIRDNLSFMANAGYRKADIDVELEDDIESWLESDIDGDVELSGFRFTAGLSVKY